MTVASTSRRPSRRSSLRGSTGATIGGSFGPVHSMTLCIVAPCTHFNKACHKVLESGGDSGSFPGRRFFLRGTGATAAGVDVGVLAFFFGTSGAGATLMAVRQLGRAEPNLSGSIALRLALSVRVAACRRAAVAMSSTTPLVAFSAFCRTSANTDRFCVAFSRLPSLLSALRLVLRPPLLLLRGSACAACVILLAFRICCSPPLPWGALRFWLPPLLPPFWAGTVL